MKQTIALGAAWTASAAAAVGLGFLAVSFVDASASPGTQPVAASTTSAGPSATPTGSAAPTSPSGPGPGSSTAEHRTAGGTVYADCTSGAPVVAAVPAPGWRVDPSDDPGKVEFDRASQEVEIRVSCVGSSPSFALDDSPSESAGSPASSTSGHDPDDSSGRGGSDDSRDDDSSGHGSDGGSGDDSSGHGSDGGSGDESSGHGGSDDG